MKTLQDCKDEVARLKYHGYKNWDDMSSELILRNHEGAKELLDRLEQAAELYAKAYHEDKTRNTTCDHRYHNQNGRYMLYERYCEKCGKYLESNPTE